ncbi:MAG: type II secretion system protein GspM [Thermodesulfobacteriota bacterium]
MWDKLGKREKVVLAGGAAFVILFLCYQLIVAQAVAFHARQKAAIVRAQVDLRKMDELSTRVKELLSKSEQAQNRYSSRQPGFRLFTFLDQLAGESDVKKYIKYMKPTLTPIPDSEFKSSQVEMKLAGLSMEQLLDFLYRVESSKNQVAVRRLAITETGRGDRLIDAVIQASTLEKS